jgi:hypothetical protein
MNPMTDHQHYSIENFGHKDDKWLPARMPEIDNDMIEIERQNNAVTKRNTAKYRC